MKTRYVLAILLFILTIGLASAAHAGGCIPIAYGQTATGSIDNAVSGDFYCFDGTAGDVVVIDLTATSGNLDTLVALQERGNTLVENDDVDGNTTNSQLQFTLPATGTYEIFATRYDFIDGKTSGDFSLTLTATTASGSTGTDGTTGGKPGTTTNPAGTDTTGQTGTTTGTTSSTTANLSQIAFTSNRDGNFNIYAMGADGANPQQLTGNNTDEFLIAWSPDGSQIAYVSVPSGDFDPIDIHVMNADGSNQRLVSSGHSETFVLSWSPDGRQIAFESWLAGPSNIYVVNADGSNQQQLTRDTFDIGPRWSPDGRQIAFVTDRDGGLSIYVMNADGSNQRSLTDSNSFEAVQPMWSPDGRQMAYVSLSASQPTLHVMNADGSNSVQLTEATSFSAGGDFGLFPAWSPDGRQILITLRSSDSFNSDLYVIDANGSNLRQLASGIEGDIRPLSWSPDGQSIAYGSESEIYVLDIASGTPMQITTDSAWDSEPAWRPSSAATASPPVAGTDPATGTTGSSGGKPGSSSGTTNPAGADPATGTTGGTNTGVTTPPQAADEETLLELLDAGWTSVGTGDYDAAIQSFTQLIAAGPPNDFLIDSYIGRALAYGLTGQCNEARSDLQSVATLNSTRADEIEAIEEELASYGC